jgi:hypothetical protein
MVQMIKQIQIGDISPPVLLSRLSGIFIILGSLSLFAMSMLHGSTIIIGGPLHVLSLMDSHWLAALVSSISFSMGGLILYSSHKMRKYPEDKVWATMIILGSIVGLFYIGGFGLGGILGLIGGVMGLERRS